MELRRFFLSLPSAAARAEYAERAGTKKLYVHQLISVKSRRKASHDLARRLSAASEGWVDRTGIPLGVVELHEIRPDIWSAP